MNNNIFGSNSNGPKGRVYSKGFYIVLLLCIIAIGITSYVIFSYNSNAQMENSLDSALENKIPQQKAASEPVIVKDGAAPTEQSIGTAATKVITQKYTRAVKGDIISKFSKDELVFSKTMNDWRVHLGTDYKASLGTSIKAIADGTVKKVYSDDLMGQTVVISHAEDTVSTYSNLTVNVPVKEGQAVKQGDTIGGVGETAIAEIAQEAHVHLEVTQKGEYIDPESLFK